MEKKRKAPGSFTLTRRSFARAITLAGAGIAITPSLTGQTSPLPVSSGRENQDSPADPWKVHLFSKHLQFLDYSEMAEVCAAAGLDGVDLTVRPGGHVLPEHVERDLPLAAEAIRKAGLQLVMMTTGITDPEDPLTRRILETAASSGIKYYRMGYYRYNENTGIEENLSKIREKMGLLAALNREYGIHGAYQNHSGSRFGGPVWDIWEVIREMDPQWIGCQYDIRHAVVEGAQSWPLGLNLLSNHIHYLVAKDFLWEKAGDAWRIKNVPIGEGMVDFDAFFSKVRELKISGPISLHIEYPVYGDDDVTVEERKASARSIIEQEVNTLKAILAASQLTS